MDTKDNSWTKAGVDEAAYAALARGMPASEVWSLQKTLEVADGAVGVPVLSGLAKNYAYQPGPVDLNKLWKKLGVVRTPRGMRLDDHAPLASVRRAIVQAGPLTSVAKR